MKFVKANLDGHQLKLLIEALEAYQKEMKGWNPNIEQSSIRKIFESQTANEISQINCLIGYFQRGLNNTPNGQFIPES